MKKYHEVPFSKKDFILQNSGKFSEKYIKVQELGSGGFSKVFRVQNKITKDIFACKELIKNKIKDIEKFQNEINIMSKCDHPNIVKLSEIYEDKRHLYLLMEECNGGTLIDRLLQKMEDKDETFNEKEAAIIFKQIMSAICYCHSQGIAHRDLKMENVLFLDKTEDSPIKIIDFGLSQYIQFCPKGLMEIITGKKNKTKNMTASVGTPLYISPEVLKEDYTQKCDIWSAGVILYAILSGSFPFDGDSEKEIFKAILNKKYEFPKEDWENISDEAKDLIKNMLCDEDKRFTAEMVLNHPWIVKLAPNSKGCISKLNIKHLEDYKNSCNFKKFILTYISTRLKDKEIKELKEIFYEMDVNKDGTLTIEEIKKCLLKLKSNKELNNEEIENLFKGIDTNNSKKIEYTEFISAAFEEKEYLKEEKLLITFKVFDKDGTGKISKDDIKKILNKEDIEEEDLKQFINKFDLDGDGEIDYYEFLSNMNKINSGNN